MFDGKTEKEYKVLIPKDIFDARKPCKLYGYFKKNTEIFNITGNTLQKCKGGFLGEIFPDSSTMENSKKLSGWFSEDGVRFFCRGKEYKVEVYDTCLNIFSRNTGILESSAMLSKRAVILGCGSVGSLVALELARAGVGHFLLVDMDIIEYHNLCRHQCGISDVGEYKVDALAERINDVNPTAEVRKLRVPIENVAQSEFERFCGGTDTVVIGCADNRNADAYANMIAARMGAGFVSVGFWERAVAGEIFYWLPGRNMPCCGCALGRVKTPVATTNYHHVYSNELDVTKIKFAPGISADINFITIIGIKIALDILNISDKNYIPRLLNYLKQYTLVCNTSNPAIGGVTVEIFSHPLQVTTSLKVDFSGECKNIGMCRYEL